jgi:predicted enzyme related to lactoylglutathione lyase
MTRGVALAFTVGLGIAAAAGGRVFSPVASAQAPIPDGRFVWQDLMTTDPPAARAFYAALFGWTFEEADRNGRPYLIARTPRGPVGGIVDVRNLEGAGSQWVSYVAVADLSGTVHRLQAAGGTVAVPPARLEAGRVSIIVDPQGAPLGLLQPETEMLERLPDDSAPIPSHFFWREYLTQDASQAVSFYKNLLGYEAAVTDTQLGVEYFVLRRDRPRAGLFQLPADAKEVRPHWLPYILADDPSALASRVAGLGGRVLVEPSTDRRKGTLAVVADPTGAVVALQKYPF